MVLTNDLSLIHLHPTGTSQAAIGTGTTAASIKITVTMVVAASHRRHIMVEETLHLPNNNSPRRLALMVAVMEVAKDTLQPQKSNNPKRPARTEATSSNHKKPTRLNLAARTPRPMITPLPTKPRPRAPHTISTPQQSSNRKKPTRINLAAQILRHIRPTQLSKCKLHPPQVI